MNSKASKIPKQTLALQQKIISDMQKLEQKDPTKIVIKTRHEFLKPILEAIERATSNGYTLADLAEFMTSCGYSITPGSLRSYVAKLRREKKAAVNKKLPIGNDSELKIDDELRVENQMDSNQHIKNENINKNSGSGDCKSQNAGELQIAKQVYSNQENIDMVNNIPVLKDNNEYSQMFVQEGDLR